MNPVVRLDFLTLLDDSRFPEKLVAPKPNGNSLNATRQNVDARLSVFKMHGLQATA